MTLEHYLKEIEVHPLLSREEERVLARKSKYDDLAKEDFINSNLRLVVKIARKYAFNNGNLLDLIQEGNIGLMRAVDGFESSRGNKFSTYATWWINSFIVRHLKKSEIDSLPEYLQKLERNFNKVIEDFFKKNEFEPTDDYLAEISKDYFGKKYTLNEIRQFRQTFYEFKGASLDCPVKQDSKTDLSNFIIQEDQNSVFNKLSFNDLKNLVKEHIEKLTPKDKKIIKMILFEDCRFEDVALKLKTTRENVKQSYSRSKRILKNPILKDSKIKSYLNH